MLRPAPLSSVLNEEVSLEGLEGATLDTLWNRLAIRLKMKMPLPQPFCDSVWSLVVRQSEYSFYELPTPRKPFEFFDRMQHVDPATGVMKEPKDYPGHRFRYEPILAEGVRGSCECYESRAVVDREVLMGMSWREVDAKWPFQFVVMASQKMRESFIVNSNFTLDFTIIQYCMLEWIARARFNGETSQGKYSLLELTKDSSILYYNRKFLTDYKLITRQSLCQRTGESSIQGMVFHLPRYYNEMKPKNLMITEKVVNILKQRPNYQADYEEIKQIVLGRSEARKWFRCPEFAKYIRTDETVPYRVLYPDADEREWKMKNRKCEEKQVRVMRLIDPTADIYELWYKDEVPEEDQNDGILNSQKAYIDMPILQQAYNIVAAAGESGVSQSSMALQMGLDKLNARGVVKNLMRLKAVEGHAVDEGRQRTTKYFIPGLTQQAVSFDKEIQYIQLMNNQIVQQQLQQSEPQMILPDEAIPSTSSTPQQIVKSEAGANFSITIEPDDPVPGELEEETSNTTLANPEALDAVQCEINITDQVVSLKKAQAGLSGMMKSKHLSAKMLRRCNLIVDLVKAFQVLEPRTILKKINDHEKSLGNKSEACNKSVLRLLGKLAADKFLKIANVRLVKEDRELSVIYACENSVDENSKVLQCKIDSAKTRMLLQNPGSVAMVSKKLATAAEAMEEANVPKTGYSYEGTLAKCLRMKLFHEFLFYLIYSHPEDAPVLNAKEWSRLPGLEDFNEPFSPIYSTDGWKIFVPPLNTYDDYGAGWAVITDITIRLPLSIFCQICTFGFYTKELDYYLNHPLRRHMLIKQLPRPIRLQLFRQRKYVYNIYELCSKLCYAGLLQFGPQRAKDRDQTYIYLNRHTALLDTRSSEVGYNEIEEKDYPMLGFQFVAPEDLGGYWETLYSYAMETILNRRSVAVGKEILVQQLAVKPEMLEAVKPRTPAEAIVNDVQRLPPGDSRGAAGMDTAMFIHLKSNWHKIMNYAPAERANQKAKIKRMKTVKKMIAINKEKAAEAAAAGPIAARNTKRLTAPKDPKDKKLVLKSKLTVKPFASTYRKYGEKKHAIKIRKIESRVSKARARNIYDEVDRRALKLMKKLRVDWNRHEDAMLLLCRIGVHYLFGEQNLKQNTILTSSIYRDILHWTDPGSQNKTSRACQRRTNYMVKHKHGNASSIKLCVEEAKLNPVIERRFGADFMQNLRREYPGNDEFAMALKVHFVELVYMLKKTLTKLNSDHFRGVADEDTSDRLFIPNSVPEFERRFNVLQMQDKVDGLNYDRNPNCQEDIILFKLVTLIHSAVTNVKDRSNFNVQLFNIYKNYSEKHLSAAMKMVRSYKMISLTRKLKAAKVIPSSIVPNYDNPYRVSVTYLNQLCTKIPFEIFGLVYENYMRLIDRASFEEAVTFDDGGQGLMLLLAELLAIERAEMQLEAPAQYIQVNPELQNTSKGDELGKVFTEFPVGDEDKAGGSQESEPEIPEIKPEPDPKKLRFNSCNDVCFNYVTHPVEKLTKIPMEYLHFFCLLNSFRERSYLRNYKIDQTANICAMPDCILLDADRGLMTKCIAIALARRDTIERLKMSKVSRIEMTPALSLREDNLIQFFTRSVNEYVKARTELQRRDLGKIADGMKKQINMVELADEIVRFDKAQDFNWLDRYEITQVEDYEGRDDDGDDLNAFSRNLPVRDEVTEKVYKMHNFYVVTYLKINVRLLYEHPNLLKQRVQFDNRSIPRVFLPENYELRQDILTKITSDAIWPPQEELEPLLEQASPLIYQNPRLSALASFIEDREYFGASVQDLADRFRNRDELRSDLQMLINFKFILRTGYRHVVYIHWQYVQPWLIKTSCVVHDQPEASSSSAGPSSLKRRRSEDQDEESPPPRKARRQELERRLEEAVERDRYKPKKNLSLSMHPWHKVDGAVNHRLLYRWLTSLLMYCISHPGVLLTVIYSRFNLMAPVHLYYLLEILQEYGCIKLFVMDVRPKRTLFSTYRPVKTEPATEFDREEHTYIEPCPSALSTLSMFIGDHRKFQENFLAPPKNVQAEGDDEEDEEEAGEINSQDSDKE
ncbi:general transcription factor 3C polypeptide 1 [Culex pipiens pallens]|uniref:general transcription factor 3C polypeptide 1 n=1 Tax=Culex pipiens pallens TaxID=42434 RepID=UPI00195394B0|nr:general transcription factor 3C polypeptide 1 [Culex pipiens pallens]